MILSILILASIVGIGIVYAMNKILQDTVNEVARQQDDITRLVEAIDRLPNPATRSEVDGLKAFAAYIVDSQIADIRNQFDV